jgi:hypothetical protein
MIITNITHSLDRLKILFKKFKRLYNKDGKKLNKYFYEIQKEALLTDAHLNNYLGANIVCPILLAELKLYNEIIHKMYIDILVNRKQEF